MTTVTSLTADRMLAIEAGSVVSGTVDASGNLILTKHDGSQINAGSVIGPQGPQGPVGSFLSVLAAKQILDVGMPNQIRAGRQLSPADFANIGLSAPVALWNLSDLSDASGNGRALLNKNAVPFDIGINGIANTAARFNGTTGQALYISDTGAADPFRIKTGSIGCWFKSARADAGYTQALITKQATAAGNYSWAMYQNSTGYARFDVFPDGSSGVTCMGMSNVQDNCWHFVVATIDGAAIRLYVDGMLENILGSASPFSGNGPLNIGSQATDAANNGSIPLWGRVDEAFVTNDVLTEDQIRNLYCAKISHTLGSIPARFSLNVRRRRRGAALVASDFPTQPLRLHNFSAGSLNDEGSNNTPLTNNGGAISVAGADGTAGNAFNFNGSSQSLLSTDAGLPAGVATRSFGAWLKASMNAGAPTVIAVLWGSNAQYLGASSGNAMAYSPSGEVITGPFIGDGQWHFVVCVEDNAAVDGLKRRLYCDGKLVAIGTNMSTGITLAGANGFHIAQYTSASNYWNGQIDGVFVCGYALTHEQILALYDKGVQALAPSPKNPGDHIEAMDANNILAIFDTLDSVGQIDLAVAA